MKRKKNLIRAISLFLALMMTLVMVSACATPETQGSATPNATAPATTGASSPAASPADAGGAKDTIALVNLTLRSFFFTVQNESVKRGAEGLGYKFVSVDSNLDAALQNTQYQNYIAQGVKAIVCDAVDSDGLVDMVNKAHEAGIYTAMVDTVVTGGHVDISVAFDNLAAGRLAGQQVVDALTKKYGEPKGSVLNLYGRMSSQAGRLRSQGFEEVIKKYPKIEYKATQVLNVAETHDGVVNALTTNPDLDAIFNYTEGSYDAMVEALQKFDRWKKMGEDGHMILVTVDGTPPALNYIKQGYAEAAVAQDSFAYGQIATELLGKYTFNGKPIPLGKYTNNKYYWETCEIVDSPSGPLVNVPTYVINKDNVDDPRHWANMGVNEWGLKYK